MKKIRFYGFFFLTVILILFFKLISPLHGIILYEVTQAGPPIVTEEGILFTFKDEIKEPRYVMVSGDFNRWVEPLMMTKNRHDVFVYMYSAKDEKSIVLNKGKYRYRYLVDGIWKKDPRNDISVFDSFGTELSLFEIRTALILLDRNPVNIEKNRYIFYYKDPSALNVYLVGDFNNFNPYSHPMQKNKSGYWEIEVDLPPGSHTYRYFVDGIFRKDPLSTTIVQDRFDNEYTNISLPYK